MQSDTVIIVDTLHSKQQAASYSSLAIELIKKFDLPLCPQFFELWYVYFSQENASLMQAVDLALDKNDKVLSANQCLEIYAMHLDQTHKEEQVEKAGSQIQSSIHTINSIVTEAADTTRNYNASLGELKGALESSSNGSEALSASISKVSSETEALLKTHSVLEDQLQKQTQFILQLQNDINVARREALTDGLTNIANRKAFDQKIHDVIKLYSNKNGEPFSLILMDIDHFKSFNDNYGHLIGDQVLRLVAKTLTNGVKGQDFVARFGGEEFAVLLPETNQHDAHRVADMLREAVAKKQVVNRSNNQRLGKVTMSGGVTEYFYGDTPQHMISRADTALYEAKDSGRNQICRAKVALSRD